MSVQEQTERSLGVPGFEDPEVRKTFYPGISKESMWESSKEDEDLSKMGERAMDRYRYSMSELDLECTVNLATGQITVHSVNGVDLERDLKL